MQKHTHTTLLLLLNKKNEQEVLVICPRSKKKGQEFEKKLREVYGYPEKFLYIQ